MRSVGGRKNLLTFMVDMMAETRRYGEVDLYGLSCLMAMNGASITSTKDNMQDAYLMVQSKRRVCQVVAEEVLLLLNVMC